MNPGELVGGRFRLEEQVASGGMGTVFRATDETDRRVVALKILASGEVTDVERARREAQILAGLVHPSIVAYVADGITDTGLLFLAMEWLDGVTVAQRLGDEGFTLREAIAVASGVADALGTAASAGILHRDVKPSNVLLRDGRPDRAVLIDFGVARVVGTARTLTRTGTAIGTPGYMSPEQARGDRTIGPAADVFGLGCVLYECATGRPAFSGTLSVAVLTKILFGEPAPMADLCPEAMPTVADVVRRMLRKDPASRIADGRAAFDELARLDAIPDGPRRSATRLVAEPTRRPPPVVQCIVGAARGQPDDMLEPPSPEQHDALVAAAAEVGARLEILATGGVVAQLEGDARHATERAASFALAMRGILAGWTIVISAAGPDLDAIVDRGTELLSRTALESIFRRRAGPGIAVDPKSVSLLEREFELSGDRDSPRLVGRRRRT